MSVLELPYDTALRIVYELETLGMLRSVDAPKIVCHDLISVSACKKLLPISKALLHRAIAQSLSFGNSGTDGASLFFPSLMHWKEAGDWKKVLDLALGHGKDIESNWQPVEILHLLESFPSQFLSDAESIELSGICSRLRVTCGFYLEELGENNGSVVLPAANSDLTSHAAEKALSLVDSAYRSDVSVDQNLLIEFSAGVAQLSHLPLHLRIRAVSISLIILSNECESETAHQLWKVIEDALDSSTGSLDVPRAAILYHTNYGDVSVAKSIARRMLQEARKDGMALSAPIDAIRAAFSLRITSSIEESIEAFTFAYECASKLEIPVVAMNACWQIAQGYLDLGLRRNFEQWALRLKELHERCADRVSTNFATALYCRNAIELGRSDEAKRFYLQFVADLPKRPTRRAACHAIALKTAIDLLEPEWKPSPAQIESLGQFANRITRFGASDFFASVYIDSLARVDLTSARTFLQQYLEELRRDCSEHSHRLSRSIKHLE